MNRFGGLVWRSEYTGHRFCDRKASGISKSVVSISSRDRAPFASPKASHANRNHSPTNFYLPLQDGQSLAIRTEKRLILLLL